MSKRHSTRDFGKMDDSVGRSSPPLRRFRKAAKLYDDDLLSNQPDDCLVNIMSFLDRDTLDSMRRVSQRMFPLADKFNHVKRQLQCLSIVQTINGHIFYARLTEFPGRCFKYSLFLKKETGEVRGSHKPVGYDEIASRFFEGPDDVPFDVLIDAPFGINCALFFAGKIRRLHMENTRLDYSVESKYFVQMLLHLKPIETKINGFSSRSITNDHEIFATDFLMQFSNLRPLQHLHIEQPITSRSYTHIGLTDVDIIRGFSHFVLHTLYLNQQTFVHLVNTHLSEPNAGAHWEFHLSIPRQLRHQHLFYAGLTHFVNLTYNDDNEEKVLTFGRIDNENSARIVYKPFNVPNGNLYIRDDPIVLITLINNQRWMYNEA